VVQKHQTMPQNTHMNEHRKWRIGIQQMLPRSRERVTRIQGNSRDEVPDHDTDYNGRKQNVDGLIE
jgi:hypothetical protein